jgi:hypothetical protein
MGLVDIQSLQKKVMKLERQVDELEARLKKQTDELWIELRKIQRGRT